MGFLLRKNSGIQENNEMSSVCLEKRWDFTCSCVIPDRKSQRQQTAHSMRKPAWWAVHRSLLNLYCCLLMNFFPVVLSRRIPGLLRPTAPPPGADPPCLFSVCHSSPPVHSSFSPLSILATQSLSHPTPSFWEPWLSFQARLRSASSTCFKTAHLSPLGRLLASCPLPQTWVLQIFYSFLSVCFLFQRGCRHFQGWESFSAPERSTACVEIHAHTQTHSYIHICSYICTQT